MNEIITQIVESEDLHIYQGEFIKNVEFIEDFLKGWKYRNIYNKFSISCCVDTGM